MLDDILRERFVPEPPSNLAYRIIEAAKPRGEEKGLTWAGIGRGFAELFVIPQPVFVMSAILILGVSVGTYYASEQHMEIKMVNDTMSSFITADLSVDYGEFQ